MSRPYRPNYTDRISQIIPTPPGLNLEAEVHCSEPDGSKSIITLPVVALAVVDCKDDEEEWQFVTGLILYSDCIERADEDPEFRRYHTTSTNTP